MIGCDMSRRVIAGNRGKCLTSGPLRCTISHYTTDFPQLRIILQFTVMSQIFWTCSKYYDGLQYPPIVRIAADIIGEGLTLHDVLSATVSWGPSQVVGSSKSCSVRPLLERNYDAKKSLLNEQHVSYSIYPFKIEITIFQSVSILHTLSIGSIVSINPFLHSNGITIKAHYKNLFWWIYNERLKIIYLPIEIINSIEKNIFTITKVHINQFLELLVLCILHLYVMYTCNAILRRKRKEIKIEKEIT